MATIGLWLLLASVLTAQVHAAAGEEEQKSAVDDGLGEEVPKHEIHKRAADQAGFILMPPITMRSVPTRPAIVDSGYVSMDPFTRKVTDDEVPLDSTPPPPCHKSTVAGGIFEDGIYTPSTRGEDNTPENRAGFILLPPVTMRSMNG